MVGLKTLALSALLLALPVSAPAGSATETVSARQAPPGLVRVFATCAGRLTAQMQHQWLLSDPGADRTEADRAAMIDLLAAVQPAGAGPAVLATRLDARQAHSALLTRATFNDNAGDAAWAQRRAAAEIAACRALILP